MATATLIAPFSSNYPHPSSGAGASTPNMISSVEPRKPADDHEPPSYQSLHLISEVIHETKPGPYSPGPLSSIQPEFSLPSPFVPAPRSFPETEKHSSPQLLHPASSFPPRQDTLPAFSDSPRPPFTSRPSLPPVSDRLQSPSAKPEIPPQHHHPEQQKPPEAHHPLNRVHTVPPHVLAPYDPRVPPHTEEADYATRARHDATVDRHSESWSYPYSLSQVNRNKLVCKVFNADYLQIGSLSGTIFSFAEAYSRIAQEQHGAHPIPKRLPTEQEVSDMLSNIERIKRSLEQMKDLVQTSIQNERAREGAKLKDPNEEKHDVPMHRDAMKPQHGMPEVKKRRGMP
ncbi:hypothetical protein NW757_013872 [Fusarium falciforme]|nr:hypothetical protein NW757_013872 [Fusarium falciforme]